MTTSEQRGRRWHHRNERIVRVLREIRASNHQFMAKDVSKKADMSTARIACIMKFTKGMRFISKNEGWIFTGEEIEVPA